MRKEIYYERQCRFCRKAYALFSKKEIRGIVTCPDCLRLSPAELLAMVQRSIKNAHEKVQGM